MRQTLHFILAMACGALGAVAIKGAAGGGGVTYAVCAGVLMVCAAVNVVGAFR